MADTGKRREFNEVLAELVEFATVSGSRLTKEQVRLYFQDIIDDESKYEFIYKYLIGLKIQIDGVEDPSEYETVRPEQTDKSEDRSESIGKKETKEAENFYNMYIAELSGTKAEEEEKQELLKRHLAGDTTAVGRLTESYLQMVVDLGKEYIKSPLGRSDIVAEGNLALYEAVMDYRGDCSLIAFERYISDAVRKGIEKAIFEELGSSRISDHLADRVNALNDASTELARELGREATLKELAERLALPEQEIKELMKISIDALTIDESVKLGKE